MANNCNCNNCKLLCIIINMSHWAADSLRFGDINENCENEISFHIVVALWPTIFATNMRQLAVAEVGSRGNNRVASAMHIYELCNMRQQLRNGTQPDARVYSFMCCHLCVSVCVCVISNLHFGQVPSLDTIPHNSRNIRASGPNG